MNSPRWVKPHEPSCWKHKNSSPMPLGKMQGICPVLVHEYFHLDEEILWEASRKDIPPLITALEKLIQSNP